MSKPDVWAKFVAASANYKKNYHADEKKRPADSETPSAPRAKRPAPDSPCASAPETSHRSAVPAASAASSGPQRSKGQAAAPRNWLLQCSKPKLWSNPEPTLIVRTDPKSEPRSKIAAFDFDSTLTTHGGFYTASSVDQYSMLCADVVPTLQRLWREEGFSLVVLSNQKGIGRAVDGKRAATVKGAIDMVAKKAGVPLDACLALGADAFRKPGAGMWKWYLSRGQGAARSVEASSSFFVGDAAGRPGDHSDSDKAFASAAGLRYLVPEEIFDMGASHSGNGGHGGLGSSSLEAPPLPLEEIKAAAAAAGQGGKPILLLLSGLVGAGKSSWAARLKAASSREADATAGGGPSSGGATSSGGGGGLPCFLWKVVCQDEVGSKAKLLKRVQDLLSGCGPSKGGRRVIGVCVDRTNLTVEQRAPLLELAKETGAVAHSLVFALPVGTCIERVRSRSTHATGVVGEGGVRVLRMLMAKGLERPSSAQGGQGGERDGSQGEGFALVAEARDQEALEKLLGAYSGANTAAAVEARD